MGARQALKGSGIFITGTDTGVGKTVVTSCLGILLQEEGFDVGVMKPVQCAGDDAKFLKKSLGLNDPLRQINPCFAPEPLSPHLAFARQKKSINIYVLKKNYERIAARHDITLVEGAGGLMVPFKKNYLVVDLVWELDFDVIIVARLGLGTINHTLLTIHQARDMGLRVRGVIFNATTRQKNNIPERTNPQAIRKFGKVPVLGTIPYLSSLQRESVIKKCAG